MELSKKAILDKTHYGLNIYAHILRSFYPDELVIHLSGKKCLPARNPFNNGKETLILENRDWVFCFQDVEKPDFTGNPFDFATMFYNLSGFDLLKKLDEDLNLGILKETRFSSPCPTKKLILESIKPKVLIPKFSFFRHPVRNTIPEREISLVEVFELIKSNKYKQQTEELRSLLSPLPFGEGSGERLSTARKYKAGNFDYATFSGIFSKRGDNNLLKHSGLITIDFDHISDIETLKEKLLADEYFDTEMLFISPSGDGLKWIIAIDLTKGSHQLYFKAIAAYMLKTYQLEVDKSGKDISRACFLPYDSEVFINPKYLQL
jgi:hypothetical protein